ncbi:MAG: helix-turn-helix transcriptional regulator [Bacteroidales bacterium]|nr:helix-turn-helix transcriptional regulator [Bacteroidales bacterium]
MATVYYSDPMFDELYSRIPEESRRMSSHSFAIAAHINEILERKGWNKTDFAVAMGKKNAEISKWMSGQHNFTIATIAKIESVLGEDIIAVKKYRKPIVRYNHMPESKSQFVSDIKTKYISKGKDSSNE